MIFEQNEDQSDCYMMNNFTNHKSEQGYNMLKERSKQFNGIANSLV